jgi:hypothetical protein
MTNISTQNTIWKKIEKFFGIVGFVAGIAAIFGVYYQFQNKKNEVQFVMLSKDYLTVKNNIAGLESNYKYIGQPVKNLWLLKFKIVNSGDLTLIGTNESKSLLDSVIRFTFPNNIQILDKVNLLSNNFPEHKLSKEGLNNLSLSFKQWRPNESATYSIYVKSEITNPILLPKTSRVIKDGNIIVDDVTINQRINKQPIIDHLLANPAALIGRILGVILAGLLFLAIDLFFLGLMLPQWFKLRKWLWQHSGNFKNFIEGYDTSKIASNSNKDEFIVNRLKYINDPTALRFSTIWQDWKNKGFEKIPETASTPTTWGEFLITFLIIIILNLCTLAIISGLWLY